MPAHARYPSPLEQLSDLAVDAKFRGLTFEEFWTESLRPRVCKRCERSTIQITCPDEECGGQTVGPAPVTVTGAERPPRVVRWPTDTKDRRTWLYAVDQSKDGWRRAYEGEDAPRREVALKRLRPLLDRLEAAAEQEAEVVPA